MTKTRYEFYVKEGFKDVVIYALQQNGYYSNERQNNSLKEHIKCWPYLALYKNTKEINGNSYSRKDCDQVKTIVLTLEEFFEFIATEHKPQSKELVLTDSYTAIIYKDKVVVGCQTIDIAKVKEIIKISEELTNE